MKNLKYLTAKSTISKQAAILQFVCYMECPATNAVVTSPIDYYTQHCLHYYFKNSIYSLLSKPAIFKNLE